MAELTGVQKQYILHWGEMGTRWGINRTVAQIHALLYLSPKALPAEEIAETLSVAREAALPLRETDRGAPRAADAEEGPADFFSAMDVVLAYAAADGPDESFQHLVDRLKEGTSIAEILDDPAVRKRTALLESENECFCRDLRDYSRVEGNVVVTDFRDLDHTPIGNRFVVYALFPEVNVSVRIHWGPNRQFPVLLLGHSIFRRNCKTNVGELAARYGGGGHRGAGSIPLMEDPDQQIRMVVAELKANG